MECIIVTATQCSFIEVWLRSPGSYIPFRMLLVDEGRSLMHRLLSPSCLPGVGYLDIPLDKPEIEASEATLSLFRAASNCGNLVHDLVSFGLIPSHIGLATCSECSEFVAVCSDRIVPSGLLFGSFAVV